MSAVQSNSQRQPEWITLLRDINLLLASLKPRKMSATALMAKAQRNSQNDKWYYLSAGKCDCNTGRESTWWLRRMERRYPCSKSTFQNTRILICFVVNKLSRTPPNTHQFWLIVFDFLSTIKIRFLIVTLYVSKKCQKFLPSSDRRPQMGALMRK